MSNSIKLGALVAILLAGQALGASTIAFTLELGGDNHAADWDTCGAPPLFTGGSTTDDVVYSAGDIVTWSVKVDVSGVHSGGQIPTGAANLVVNLALTKDGGPVNITAPGAGGDAEWFSSINTGAVRTCGFLSTTATAELASFPVAWSIDGASFARVIDSPNSTNDPAAAVDIGGPIGGDPASAAVSKGFWQYPSAAGHPAGSTADPGELLGMGVGYANYIGYGCGGLFGCGSGAGLSTPGIGFSSGISEATSCAVELLNGPAFEGQIDTSGLLSGTYTLTLQAGTGNNILNTDGITDCTDVDAGAFALKADAATGDVRTFIVEGGVPPACERAVVNRQLFYGGSAWGTTPVPNTPGQPGNKVLKVPGTGAANFENVISHSRGINGIYIDLGVTGGSCDPLDVTDADFAFVYGNTTTPGTWVGAVPAPTVTVMAGAGSGGSDRVMLQWANNAIPNKNWLQIKVLANANTGLAADDVSYIGCLIGEIGDTFAPATRWTVSSTDYNGIYNNRSLSPVLNRTIVDVYDMDRSKNVNSTDYNNFGYNVRSLSPVDGLNVITP